MTGYVTDYMILRFMTLQLLFVLDISSDKCIMFEIMTFVGKNLLNSMENWERNYVYQLVKTFLNLMKKRGKKSESFDQWKIS